MTLRRRLAGWMHRLAYWIDRQADKVWDLDAHLARTRAEQDTWYAATLGVPTPLPNITARDIYQAVAATEQRRLP